MAKEYVFLDEWDVDAPQDAVFNALADARTYPDWWKPVYIEVEGDEDPAEGVTTRQHFKGKLPYTLRTTSKIVELRPAQPFPGRGRRGPDRHRQVDPGRRTATARSMSASTGSCMPIGRSSATSPRSCGRSSAGTTTGPRHARRRGCSPTRDLTPHSKRGQPRQIVSRAHALAPVALSAHLLVRIPLGLPHRRPDLTRGLDRVALPAPLRLAERLRLDPRPERRLLADRPARPRGPGQPPLRAGHQRPRDDLDDRLGMGHGPRRPHPRRLAAGQRLRAPPPSARRTTRPSTS